MIITLDKKSSDPLNQIPQENPKRKENKKIID